MHKKTLWEDKFCYYKILNTEHLTNQIGLFELPKISQKAMNISDLKFSAIPSFLNVAGDPLIDFFNIL